MARAPPPARATTRTTRSLPSNSTLRSSKPLAPPLPSSTLAPVLTRPAFCMLTSHQPSGRRYPLTRCLVPSLSPHKPGPLPPSPPRASRASLRTPRVTASSGGTISSTAEAREAIACAYPLLVVVVCRFCKNSTQRRWVATLAATRPSRWPVALCGGQDSLPTWWSSSRRALPANA